ncbi:hypothetical protein A6E15_17960 [Natrinema saccharevitans]|uniref:Uncharacterized protein n=1 Tax=Natrinema saccharevitans TaxID=301967 RepID=A0A1S8AR49_9EURY|nr:hypothetical protein A6E15_17960 [Natrinema saccharevitans]
MDVMDFFQTLTLWFVILIFLQTGSGNSGPLFTAISLFAIILVFALPLFLLIVLVTGLSDN